MKFKKIILLLISMLILANSFIGINISKAADEEQILTIKEGSNYGATIKEHNATLRFVRTYYEGNGGIYPVYCLDKSKPGVAEIEEGQYEVKVTNRITDVRLWRIIINSYPFKGFLEMGCDTPAQAFIATKAAIDCILYDKDFSDFSAINVDGEVVLRAMETLLELANDETIQPYSTEVDIVPTDEWKFETVSGRAYMARTFKIENDYLQGRYTVGLRGYVPNGTRVTSTSNTNKTNFHVTESFKVLIPNDEVDKKDTISIAVTANVVTLPIYNGEPVDRDKGYQNYLITGIRTEPGRGEEAIPYEPIGGELTITKTDTETKEKLAGAKFNVYDSNNRLLYENLKSDENGEVKIYNLLTGTYYVEETKAPEGYDQIKDIMEIQVIEGSTSNLIINNSKIVITEKESHNIVVEIVESSKVNNSITENDYYKQETNNTTTNNTEINNIHIDKTNNNTTTNTIQNNTITNTTNNTTEKNTKEENIEMNNTEKNTKEENVEINNTEKNTKEENVEINNIVKNTKEENVESNNTVNNTTEKIEKETVENNTNIETKDEIKKTTISENMVNNKKLPKTGM